MNFVGKCTQVLPSRTGTSARTGNTWMSQDYVFETEEQYPQSIVLTVFGEDRINSFGIQSGVKYSLDFDTHCNESNGRYFNSLKIFRVVNMDGAAVVQQTPAQQPPVPQAPAYQQPQAPQYAPQAPQAPQQGFATPQAPQAPPTAYQQFPNQGQPSPFAPQQAGSGNGNLPF